VLALETFPIGYDHQDNIVFTRLLAKAIYEIKSGPGKHGGKL
jgi:hypothetical protein